MTATARPTRAALLGLFVLTVVRPAYGEPDVASVVDVLARVAHWTDVTRAGEELSILGADHVRAYLDFLAEGEASAIGLGVPVSEPRRCAVGLALRAQPRAALRRALEVVARDAPSTALRLEGLRLLERVGTLDEARLLARLAAGTATRDDPIERELRLAFTAALGSLVERDPGGAADLPYQMEVAHPGLFASFVEVAGTLPPVDAVPLLTWMLGETDCLDVLALVELGGLRPPALTPFEAGDLDRVRRLLHSSDAGVATLAATAAAALDDQGAVEELVPLLGVGDKGLTDAVQRALERLTGRRFGPEPEVWERWLDAELRWWSSSAGAARETLLHGSAADAARVLGEMAGLRLHRDELAELLALGLRRGEPDVVRVCCLALGGLGSRAALPSLVDLLRTGPQSSRDAAHEALVRLTHEDLPAESEAWEALLERGR